MLVVTILWRIGDPAGVRMGRWVLRAVNLQVQGARFLHRGVLRTLQQHEKSQNA